MIRRYKRFLADIELPDGRVVTAHCPNPGAMLGLQDPGVTVWVEPNDDPRKKLDWGWRLVQTRDGAMVGIDTGAANRVVAAALAEGAIPGMSGNMRAEVKYGAASRVDFLIDNGGALTYLEVKSVTLKRGDWAEFPDTVTKRGAKHLRELQDVVAGGHRAVLLYLVQRDDCTRFRVAEDLDPGYADAARAARAGGVEIMCYDTVLSPQGVRLNRALDVGGG